MTSQELPYHLTRYPIIYDIESNKPIPMPFFTLVKLLYHDFSLLPWDRPRDFLSALQQMFRKWKIAIFHSPSLAHIKKGLGIVFVLLPELFRFLYRQVFYLFGPLVEYVILGSSRSHPSRLRRKAAQRAFSVMEEFIGTEIDFHRVEPPVAQRRGSISSIQSLKKSRPIYPNDEYLQAYNDGMVTRRSMNSRRSQLSHRSRGSHISHKSNRSHRSHRSHRSLSQDTPRPTVSKSPRTSPPPPPPPPHRTNKSRYSSRQYPYPQNTTTRAPPTYYASHHHHPVPYYYAETESMDSTPTASTSSSDYSRPDYLETMSQDSF